MLRRMERRVRKKMATIHTTVEVELHEFSTRELLQELSKRGPVPLTWLIQALKDFGCPPELIAQLEAWDATPVATPIKLKEWALACSSSQ